MRIDIREATAADAEMLAHLVTQLGYASRPAQMVRRLSALPSGRSTVLVAIVKEELVGLVQVSLQSTIAVEPGAEIAALVVDETWRGRTVGHALVEGAEAWAADRGCSIMYVRTNAVRERAHAFYRQLGFQQLKTSLVFTKQLSEEE